MKGAGPPKHWDGKAERQSGGASRLLLHEIFHFLVRQSTGTAKQSGRAAERSTRGSLQQSLQSSRAQLNLNLNLC